MGSCSARSSTATPSSGEDRGSLNLSPAQGGARERPDAVAASPLSPPEVLSSSLLLGAPAGGRALCPACLGEGPPLMLFTKNWRGPVFPASSDLVKIHPESQLVDVFFFFLFRRV